MMKISDKAEFFIFLLERYAEAKRTPAKDVLNLWRELGIVDYINDMYEQYHSERVENAIDDIERKCRILPKTGYVIENFLAERAGEE